MEIIAGTLDFELNKATAVAIGKFDGLHLGHRELIEQVLQKQSEGLTPCVLTFDPSPTIFFGFSDGKELNTAQEKRDILEQMGVEVLMEFPMTAETATMPPEVFVEEILVNKLHTKWIVAGTDVSFGDKGAGDAVLLERLSEKFGYQLTTIDKVMYEGEEISSTRIRKHLMQGDMQYVEKLLGTPYTIEGEVVHGKALGRKMGMPTVNILPSLNKLMPPCGVYFSKVFAEGKVYAGISNIGYKPTVNKEPVLGVETYIYDFSGDLYDKTIRISLLAFKRPEMQFLTIEELKQQMEEDIQAGKMYHLLKNG